MPPPILKPHLFSSLCSVIGMERHSMAVPGWWLKAWLDISLKFFKRSDCLWDFACGMFIAFGQVSFTNFWIFSLCGGNCSGANVGVATNWPQLLCASAALQIPVSVVLHECLDTSLLIFSRLCRWFCLIPPRRACYKNEFSKIVLCQSVAKHNPWSIQVSFKYNEL